MKKYSVAPNNVTKRQKISRARAADLPITVQGLARQIKEHESPCVTSLVAGELEDLDNQWLQLVDVHADHHPRVFLLKIKPWF